MIGSNGGGMDRGTNPGSNSGTDSGTNSGTFGIRENPCFFALLLRILKFDYQKPSII